MKVSLLDFRQRPKKIVSFSSFLVKFVFPNLVPQWHTFDFSRFSFFSMRITERAEYVAFFGLRLQGSLVMFVHLQISVTGTFENELAQAPKTGFACYTTGETEGSHLEG